MLPCFPLIDKHTVMSGFNRQRAHPYTSFIIIASVVLLTASPIIWYSHIPLQDYPNHLARLQIHKTLTINPHLSHFFTYRWALVPNLGIDLLTYPFLYVIPTEVVGRIAIIISFMIIYGGTILLDRKLNQDNWGLSLFSGIFLYCGALRFGFINYFIGVGFAIVALWIWIWYREKADSIRIVMFPLAGGLVLLLHLFAFGVYAVGVAGYECSLLWEKFRIEQRLRMSLFRIPAVAVFSLTTPPLLLWLNKNSNGPAQILWGYDFAKKIQGIISPLFYCQPVVEIPLLLLVFGVFAWALATKTIIVNSRMIIPLAVFAVTFIVMPFALSPTAYFADYRLPSAIAFIALVSFGWGKKSLARNNVLRLLLSVCLILRVGSIFLEWQPAQAMIEEYYTALQLVPPGSRLLVTIGDSHSLFGNRNPPLSHVPVFAAAMHGIFDPDTFTNGTEPNGFQLLSLTPDYRDYWLDAPPNASRIDDIKRYDYLVAVYRPPVRIPAGFTLREIKRGQTFVLYHIEQLTSTDSAAFSTFAPFAHHAFGALGTK
jgi:hypothetical protein